MTDEPMNLAESGAPDELLTIEETTKFLDTSKSTIYRLLAQGDLKGVKVGKQWRFKKAELTAYLERNSSVADAGPMGPIILNVQDTTDLGSELVNFSEEGMISAAHGIVRQAIRDKASDIHIEPCEKGVRVRYRLDGVLVERATIPIHNREVLTTRFKIMADMNVMEKRLPQDGRIPVKMEGKDYDVRVNVMPALYGESVVMRILDKSSVLIGLDNLGLGAGEHEALRRWSHRHNGMIIATGPSNAGKSTLLYSCLLKINSREKKIVTVEDPVEYVIPGVTQVGINERTGLRFPNAMRSMLRQDPDVILCGDLRDGETATAAATAALNGSLLFTALHTEDAPSVLTRLIDMGIERYLVAACVVGIVAMRLARRLCEHCKTVADPDEIGAIVEKVRPIAQSGGWCVVEKPVFMEAVGCEKCRFSGYHGRIGLHEVLSCNSKLVNQLLQCSSNDEMTRLAVESGMRTLFADGISKAAAGLTTIDEVIRATATWL